MSITSSNTGLRGLRAAIFESRRGRALSALIQRRGGIPLPAPALRELPPGDQKLSIVFAERLLRGEIHAVVFFTGPGFEALLDLLAARFNRREILGALGRAFLVSRGPKTSASLRAAGLTPRGRMSRPTTSPPSV